MSISSLSSSRDHQDSEVHQQHHHQQPGSLNGGRSTVARPAPQVDFAAAPPPPLEGGAVSRSVTTGTSATGGMRATRGFFNLGNTCFMNAALQCLVHTGPFQKALRNMPPPKVSHGQTLSPARQLVEACRTIMEEQWGSNDSPEGAVPSSDAYNPEAMLKAVQALNPMFQGYHQQDTQEFLRCVLDAMDEELRRKVPKYPEAYLSVHMPEELPSPNAYSSVASEAAAGSEFSDQSSTANHSPPPSVEKLAEETAWSSPVSETFLGRLISTVRCLHCNNTSTTIEPAYDVSLPIPSAPVDFSKISGGSLGTNPSTKVCGGIWGWMSSARAYLGDAKISLYDCLATFCQDEELSGSEQYHCDCCKKKCDGRKFIRFYSTPETLVLHLNRFRYDDGWFGQKNSRAVTFPVDEELNIAQFMHMDSASAVANRSEIVGGVGNQTTTYRLIGLIRHMGSVGSGHYVAYCRHEETNEWMEYDDAKVTKVDSAYVASLEAYVLFYQKVASPSRVNIVAELQSAVQAGRLPGDTPAPMVYVPRQWSVKLRYMSHPGPISTYTMVCPHKCVTEVDKEDAEERYIRIPLEFGKRFKTLYGGGPLLSTLEPCGKCSAYVRAYLNRRAEEQRLVTKYDTKEIGDGEYWCMVDAVWVNRWKSYIKKSYLDGPSLADTSDDPGPIDNSRLVAMVKGRKNCKVRHHFIAVNDRVWQLFVYFHGTEGPTICRATLDIYGEIGSPDMMSPPPQEIDVSRSGLSEAERRSIVELSHEFVDEAKADWSVYSCSGGLESSDTSGGGNAAADECNTSTSATSAGGREEVKLPIPSVHEDMGMKEEGSFRQSL
ncbi:Ubiquitin carboxyl-terminal hydrolase 20 [Perkinsus chesapeaki]|uniref:Ubiquitin carboxyl-terminal hydrolase n=1 Tax=Perkinsus chesapeaki TaxID=330153 RepID=A0A7J6MMX2_PERCH|nr:Ubiquitin carboxyl-terminal hydrolase 20 [Perkinsus chesapeaki]